MHSQADLPDAIAQLWGLQPERRRGPKARLTVGEIGAAAISLADSGGLDRVTLAEVAARVGLTTTALYRYVDSKGTLIEVMIDTALGESPRLTARRTDRRVGQWVDALWQRYADHPWLATVQPSGLPRCPSALAWMDALVGELARAGAGDPLNLALTLDVLVRGFATLQLSRAAELALPEWMSQQIAERYPHLVAAGASRAQPEPSVHDELRTAVRQLLAAEERTASSQ